MKAFFYALGAGVSFVAFEVWFWSRMQPVMQMLYAGNGIVEIFVMASAPLRLDVAFTLAVSAFLVGLMLYLAARSIATMMSGVRG